MKVIVLLSLIALVGCKDRHAADVTCLEGFSIYDTTNKISAFCGRVYYNNPGARGTDCLNVTDFGPMLRVDSFIARTALTTKHSCYNARTWGGLLK